MDPTQPYVRQMELTGKTKAAFVKAYRTMDRKRNKLASKFRTFQNKNRKYVGQSDIPPEVIEKIKADKAALEAEGNAINEEFEVAMAEFFTPEQIAQVGEITKRVAEQRARMQARRAAGGGQRGGGGAQRGGGGGGR